MNKKLLTIPALILAATVATAGLTTPASAAGLNVGATLGFGSTSANVQVRADGSNTSTGSSMGGGMGMHGGQHAPGVFGTVTAISGDTITISSKGFGQNATTTSYTVNASGATVMKANATSSLSSIAVGDTIMAEGTVSGSTVTATKINDGMMGGMGMRGSGVYGTVTAVSGSTITVQTAARTKGTTTTAAATYTVNVGSATVMKANATSSVSAIAVGDTVMVQGTVSGTTVTATRIDDGVMEKGTGSTGATMTGNGQPVIGGTVTAISGNTVTITNKSNVSYTIDISNATVTKNGTTATASNIAVGDSVLAQGTVNGTSVTAVSLTDSANTTSGTTTTHKGFFGMIGDFFSKLF